MIFFHEALKNCLLNLLIPHAAHCIRAFFMTYYVLDCVQYVFMFVFHSYLPSMHRPQRTEEYSICTGPGVICIMCVGRRVPWCRSLQRISSESGASTSDTPRILPYVSEYIQTHANCKCTLEHTLHIHKQSQNIYTHLPAFSISLCLWGNLNNNSVCNNASNANPHWSERNVSCGSAASYAHQSHNREIGIQAGCCVCLYVSATYSNVEPDAPMWASYRA